MEISDDVKVHDSKRRRKHRMKFEVGEVITKTEVEVETTEDTSVKIIKYEDEELDEKVQGKRRRKYRRNLKELECDVAEVITKTEGETWEDINVKMDIHEDLEDAVNSKRRRKQRKGSGVVEAITETNFETDADIPENHSSCDAVMPLNTNNRDPSEGHGGHAAESEDTSKRTKISAELEEKVNAKRSRKHREKECDAAEIITETKLEIDDAPEDECPHEFSHAVQVRANNPNVSDDVAEPQPEQVHTSGFPANNTKREHSIKVPRLYKEASKGLANIVEFGHGLKNALYCRKHPNIKGITALVTETIRHSNQLNYIMEKSKILEEEPNLNKCLAQILITELLWGKKRLGGQAKPILTVLKYEPKFYKVLEKYERKNRKNLTNELSSVLEPTRTTGLAHLNVKPRYVRVNTLKISLDDAIKHFISEGWIQIDDPSAEYLTYSNNISNPDGFYIDSFVPNLLVFPIGTQFQSHPLYLDGSIILQDKASCLPPLALKPRRGRTILDACAAPGMKTSFLAAMIEKDGKIIAIEKAIKRHNTLNQMLERYGVNNSEKHCVHTIHQDFTNINPNDYEYRETEYIMVDPSCSGSGMTGRVETDIQFLQSSETAAQQNDRLYALSYCQTKLLCHAMKFPNVKRIVYSTCSVHSQENEDVVAAALEYNNNSNPSEDYETTVNIFRVKEALPDWPHRLHNPNYEWASKCITASLEEDKTDGFFVAVLEKVKAKREY